MRTSIVVIGLSIALPVLLSRRLQLPAAWDRDGDGTVTPSEALASALGNTLGRASWAAASAYRAASATILLLVAGGLWLMARSLVNAIASRFVVTFEARRYPPASRQSSCRSRLWEPPSNTPRLHSLTSRSCVRRSRARSSLASSTAHVICGSARR